MAQIFSNDSEYKSKYYGARKPPSEKQLNALQEWNELQRQVGREAARAKKRAERELKAEKVRLRQESGVPTHDAVKKIMDLVSEGTERDKLRNDSDLMYGLIDYSSKLAYESEANAQNLLTYDQLDALYNDWESALDEETPF